MLVDKMDLDKDKYICESDLNILNSLSLNVPNGFISTLNNDPNSQNS